MLDLSVASFDGDGLSPISTDRVDGRAVVEAARDGLAFRLEGQNSVLHRTERSLVLKITPGTENSPDVLRFLEMLNLRPGRPYYRIQAEQRVEEDAGADGLPDAITEGTIVVNMRSILDMMTFLSKGVCVPAEHVECHIAPMTVAPDGTLFNWQNITHDIFAVGSQKHRPKNADTAVQYRGYWFYVNQSDVRSRTTLTVLELLLELQEVETTSRGPLLTLPL